MQKTSITQQTTVLNLNNQQTMMYEISVASQTSIEINIDENKTSSIVLVYKEGAGNVKLTANVKNNASLTILSLTQTNENLNIDEVFNVSKEGKLNVAYGDLNAAVLNRNAVYKLDKAADASVVSATVANTTKTINLRCEHTHSHATSDMKNFSVVLENGEISITNTGHISKGAYLSKAHQVTRVLVNGDKQKATVTPLLLIDENDVEASHATSIGQLDENQLYYMQSRGLSRNQATQLIAIGYLMPITEVIDDNELKEYLKNQIIEKVGSICSM